MKAVSPDGDLIGVMLSTVQTRDGAKPNDSNDEGRRGNAATKFDKFMALFEKVGRETDVFAAYPEINRVLVVEVVAVDDAFRGRGVCKRLFEKTKLVPTSASAEYVTPHTPYPPVVTYPVGSVDIGRRDG